jgi:hypothetical protein
MALRTRDRNPLVCPHVGGPSSDRSGRLVRRHREWVTEGAAITSPIDTALFQKGAALLITRSAVRARPGEPFNFFSLHTHHPS